MRSDSVPAGGLRWAYRHVAADPASASPDKLPVVCLHGIGSGSYSYRNTLRLLGQAGHDAYAVDWVGHGASDKVRLQGTAAGGVDTLRCAGRGCRVCRCCCPHPEPYSVCASSCARVHTPAPPAS